MRVAIFADSAGAAVSGVATMLNAVVEHAPDDLDVRVYTCARSAIQLEDYLAVRAVGVSIPFSRDMTMYVPPFRQFLQHAVADSVDLVHMTTASPMGLAAVWVASRLGLPMMGSIHTEVTPGVIPVSRT